MLSTGLTIIIYFEKMAIGTGQVSSKQKIRESLDFEWLQLNGINSNADDQQSTY